MQTNRVSVLKLKNLLVQYLSSVQLNFKIIYFAVVPRKRGVDSEYDGLARECGWSERVEIQANGSPLHQSFFGPG